MTESLGERIARLRKAAKMTQEVLALRLAVGQGSLSRWEAGLFEPSASELQQLSEALNVNIHYLITGEGPEGVPGQQEAAGGVRSVVARLRKALDEIEATLAGGASAGERRERAQRVDQRHREVQADKEHSGQRQPPARRKKGRG